MGGGQNTRKELAHGYQQQEANMLINETSF